MNTLESKYWINKIGAAEFWLNWSQTVCAHPGGLPTWVTCVKPSLYVRYRFSWQSYFRFLLYFFVTTNYYKTKSSATSLSLFPRQTHMYTTERFFNETKSRLLIYSLFCRSYFVHHTYKPFAFVQNYYFYYSLSRNTYKNYGIFVELSYDIYFIQKIPSWSTIKQH